MGFFGRLLGGALGSLGSALLPIPGANGKMIGEHIGDNLLPFRKGGKVKKGKKAKAPKKEKAKKAKKPKKAKK